MKELTVQVLPHSEAHLLWKWREIQINGSFSTWSFHLDLVIHNFKVNSDPDKIEVKKNENKALIHFQESSEMSYVLGASIGGHCHKTKIEVEYESGKCSM
ncbi:27920_t:CDS:2 [Dentiscutata erythropus]|uniref:27920_t:CDS:1 n=1 Tax=Dentiscutata erythropus TaxID=1348616 RepID=A0A9N9H1H8_9GLOM|nr:27920_t:CDS:2 [Dentiscutata erythropus]